MKEKDGCKENLDVEKREKKILHRVEKIERTEKVRFREKVLSKRPFCTRHSDTRADVCHSSRLSVRKYW